MVEHARIFPLPSVRPSLYPRTHTHVRPLACRARVTGKRSLSPQLRTKRQINQQDGRFSQRGGVGGERVAVIRALISHRRTGTFFGYDAGSSNGGRGDEGDGDGASCPAGFSKPQALQAEELRAPVLPEAAGVFVSQRQRCSAQLSSDLFGQKATRNGRPLSLRL